MAIANSPSNPVSTSSLWYYGGQVKTSPSQTDDFWTNALVRLDLERAWGTGTPVIGVIDRETSNYISPPAVSLGALWASSDGSTLYLYGGQFQDNPSVAVPAQNVYAYSIADDDWSIVQTTGDEVTRPAEGMTTVVPGQGDGGDNVGYYFGGHLDTHTVEGWSNQVARVFLDSLVSFDLGNQQFTNITAFSNTGSTSNSSSVSSVPIHRADGTLTWVPGVGTNGKGVLIAIGGATESQYVDNAVLDVYDIGAQGWTKQATLGDTIGSRVNHCAVRASAKVDGSMTHQIYVYGGQQLNQSDRDSAMYILNIKDGTYTWKFVGDNLPGQPTGRAGHQCALQGNQLIVVGGLVSSSILCDTPGIYVYNVSSSAWQDSYQPLTTYSTPALIRNLTGGIGTGGSSSGAGSATGGDGSQFADTSESGSSSSSDSGSSSGSGSGTNTGSGSNGDLSSGGGGKTSIAPIAGGAAGGAVVLILLAILAFFLMRRRRRRREENRLAPLSATRSGVVRSDSANSSEQHHLFSEKGHHRDSSSNGSSHTNPYMYGSPQSYQHPFASPAGGRRGSLEPVLSAHDDVEEQTAGMDLSFTGAHFAPKRELRVTNPSDA